MGGGFSHRRRTRARRAQWVVLWVLWLGHSGPVAAQSGLEQARRLYNAGMFDGAIAAAESSRGGPRVVSAAALIVARSRLERFRLLGDPQELEQARVELMSVNPADLSAQERIEWQTGLGEALLFDNQPGPASEVFGTLVSSARARLAPGGTEKLLEWLAVSVSRFAETLGGDARADQYRRLLSILTPVLQTEPMSRAAIYWSAVASRGAGDLDGAWNVAVAGWVREGSHPDGGSLRNDLERFIVQTVIPERAQARTGQRLDSRTTIAEIAALTEGWRAFTQRWSEED